MSLVGLDASELRIAAVEVDGDDEFPADGSSDWGGVSALDRPNWLGAGSEADSSWAEGSTAGPITRAVPAPPENPRAARPTKTSRVTGRGPGVVDDAALLTYSPFLVRGSGGGKSHRYAG